MARSTTIHRKWARFELSAAAGSRVFVAGTFNNWEATDMPLAEEQPGLFGTTALLPKGTHEYKFVVNGEWRCDPNCPDWVPNSYGTLNSRMQVG